MHFIDRRATVLLAVLSLWACGEPVPEPSPDPGVPPGTSSPAPDAPARDDQPGDPARGGDREAVVVQVYFTRDEEPVPVEREIHRTPGVLRATLERLLEGPTAAERAAGLSSWFSDQTAGMLRGVHVDDQGRAVVDFQDFSSVISGASSAAGGRILLNELNHTVFQFDTVRSVEYRLEGSCDAFWNWLQSECGVVERP